MKQGEEVVEELDVLSRQLLQDPVTRGKLRVRRVIEAPDIVIHHMLLLCTRNTFVGEQSLIFVKFLEKFILCMCFCVTASVSD